jgi:spore coat polysaccharide biosynthesis protein SpsF
VKVVAVVQARMGSTRLPGKVLLEVAGAPMLQRMIERVSFARTLSEVVVATTSDASDDPVRDLCARRGFQCVSGHPTDLIDRHLQAAPDADVVVKIPSDCPLIDPRIIDRVVGEFLVAPAAFDYLSNLHPPSYPDGNDVEVMPRAALELAFHQARRPHEREHTTPFLWDDPARFRLGNVSYQRDLSMSHRLTVDYPADYALVKAVYAALQRQGDPFSLEEILAFLDQHPEVYALNHHLCGVNWYRHHLDELRTIGAADTVAP